jgi:beta-N-acetylhexosaminidase
MTATLRRAAGSLLVVGLGGTELTGLERAWLKLVRPAGVILFRRNIAEVAQTRALLGEAMDLCGANALRCVDVEGGTVDRLRDALAPMPSAQAVARADHQLTQRTNASTPRSQKRDRGHPARLLGSLPRSQKRGLGHPTFAYKQGELVGRGAKAFGLNTTLAPVLDLGLPASAAVMGTRVAAESGADVVDYARAFVAGLAAQGVAGCGKHFPGLGGGTLDSHVETPAIERTWRELWHEDLEPYRALRDELPMVMVNHAAYPQTRGGDRPATASAFWVTTVLRKRIGYRGIVFSDDLEMGGILKYMPIEEAAVAAVRAGMDLLEICHSPELILRAYEGLVAEGERSPVFARLIVARAREVERKKARLFKDGIGRALTGRQFEVLRAEVIRFREEVMKKADAVVDAARRSTLVETV